MGALSSRLKGDGPKDKEAQFADRQKLFPWLPKYYVAQKQLLGIAAAVYGVILAYYLMLTTNPQGMISAAMAGFGMNVYKQYNIFTVDEFADKSVKMSTGWKNLLRGGLLAVIATGLGVFAFYSAPVYISEALNKTLPLWFFENGGALTTTGAVLANFLFTGFLR